MLTHNVISVSGGKDSTALLLLAIERGADNLQAVFADTGNELQETYDYLNYLETALNIPIRRVKADFSEQIAHKRTVVETKWRADGVAEWAIQSALAVLQPTGNPFLDLCLWKGRFPSTKARFCSEELKRNPIIEQVFFPLMDTGNQIISWQGVRANESDSRAKLPVSDDQGGGLTNYRPILHWTVSEVFAMHDKYGILPNPLYLQGMGRVGCICIHSRKKELTAIATRFPLEIDRLIEWERLVSFASKRQSATFFTSDQRGHGIAEIVEWAKTTHGGSQYDLLPDDDHSCSSIYGLCESAS